MKIAGLADRTAADKLRRSEIVVPRSEVGPLPAGSYYVFDIVGMQVITPAGEVLGSIKEVIANPANDIYVLASPGRPDSYIPAIRQVVREIDVPGRRMVIDPWPGMLAEGEAGGS